MRGDGKETGTARAGAVSGDGDPAGVAAERPDVLADPKFLIF